MRLFFMWLFFLLLSCCFCCLSSISKNGFAGVSLIQIEQENLRWFGRGQFQCS
jgi:hypothetical protein